MLFIERLTEEELLFFEAERSTLRDAAHLPVSWVLRLRRLIGHAPRGRAILRRRRLTTERLMRTLSAELGAPVVEALLLRSPVRGWRPSCPRLQRAVHALMAPVLLWLSWFDALVPDAELNPPHRRSSSSDVGPIPFPSCLECVLEPCS